MMRRRPLRRAAVVGGVAAVAHHAGKNAGEAQAAQQAPQQYAPEPPPAPAPAAGEDMVTQLENLKKLLDQGILTQAEFDTQKQKILASS
jgi:hypothetical protein